MFTQGADERARATTGGSESGRHPIARTIVRDAGENAHGAPARRRRPPARVEIGLPAGHRGRTPAPRTVAGTSATRAKHGRILVARQPATFRRAPPRCSRAWTRHRVGEAIDGVQAVKLAVEWDATCDAQRHRVDRIGPDRDRRLRRVARRIRRRLGRLESASSRSRGYGDSEATPNRHRGRIRRAPPRGKPIDKDVTLDSSAPACQPATERRCARPSARSRDGKIEADKHIERRSEAQRRKPENEEEKYETRPQAEMVGQETNLDGPRRDIRDGSKAESVG